VPGSTAIDPEFRFISGTNALVPLLNVSTALSIEEYNTYRAVGGRHESFIGLQPIRVRPMSAGTAGR
jgi:hypothetical protein